MVLDAARSRPDEWEVTAYVDPERHPELERSGLEWLGSDAEAIPLLRGRRCILAVGGTAGSTLRQQIERQYADSGAVWASVVHVSAVLASDAVISEGVVILAGSVVNPGAVIGKHAIVNSGVVVEHDVVVGSFVHLAPGSIIGGGVNVGAGAFIGLGARIRDHVGIGAYATVGLGAAVVEDVPNGETWLGVPARPSRKSARPTP